MNALPTSTFQPSVPSLPLAEFLSTQGPLLDVRSPGEWQHGRIPGSINLPLFTDTERAAVGTAYKNSGRQKAVKLGLELVAPRLPLFSAVATELGALLKESAGLAKDGRTPTTIRIHCARGGMRSGSLAFLISMLALPCVTLEGGYKAFRNFTLERVVRPIPNLVVLSGPTGSGKSEILRTLKKDGRRVLDLEAAAVHRGSAFGGILPLSPWQPAGLEPFQLSQRAKAALEAAGGSLEAPLTTEQPSTEHFQNLVAMELDHLLSQPSSFEEPIFAEHENRTIGKISLPAELHASLCNSPRISLSVPRSERLERIMEEYGPSHLQPLIDATNRISKRLGGERTQRVISLLKDGMIAEAADILLDYYDVLYAKAAAQRGDAPIKTIEGSGWDTQKWADMIYREAKELLAARKMMAVSMGTPVGG